MQRAALSLFGFSLGLVLAGSPAAQAGYSLSFDGGDWVDCGNHTEFDLSADMTFEAWVKLASLGGYNIFLSKDEGAGNFMPKYFWGLQDLGGGNCAQVFHLNGPGGNPNGEWLYSAQWAPALGSWHHYALVKQGSSYSFYLDGVYTGGGSTGFAPPPIDQSLQLGRAEGVALNGLLDEVRVWSLARSGDEIAAEMHQRLTGRELGLAGYWHLDEGAGQTTADASGHGYGGQLGSLPDADDHDPTWSADEPTTGVDGLPAAAGLELACFPNPFNPRASFRIAAAAPGTASLAVFDTRGRRLRTLWAGWLPAGARELVWDGRDGEGRALPSGVYLARLLQGEASVVIRALLVR